MASTQPTEFHIQMLAEWTGVAHGKVTWIPYFLLDWELPEIEFLMCILLFHFPDLLSVKYVLFDETLANHVYFLMIEIIHDNNIDYIFALNKGHNSIIKVY